MKSIYFKAIVILVITFFFPHSSGAQLRQTTPSETMIKIPESSVRPRFILVIPAKSRLLAGGAPVGATLQGSGLDRMTAVQILQNNSPVRDIEARLGSGEKTIRSVTFSAKSNATPRTYIIKGISTNNEGSLLFIQLEVLLEYARADSQLQGALIELYKTLKDVASDKEIEAKKDKLGRSQPTAQVPVAPGPLQTDLLPDLVVSKVTFTPINATTIDRIMINVEIKNQGNAAAVIPAGAAIWLATKPTGGGLGVESKGETINPGVSFSRSLQLFNAGELKPGTYKIKVTVDPENRVVKSGETKNPHVISLTIMDKQPLSPATVGENVAALQSSTKKWKLHYQNASNLTKAFLPCNFTKEIAHRIERELNSIDDTMTYIEAQNQLNRQNTTIIQEKLNNHINNIEKLLDQARNKRKEYLASHPNKPASFENFDQKANQLFNLLSSVSKSMKEMQQGIIRNML